MRPTCALSRVPRATLGATLTAGSLTLTASHHLLSPSLAHSWESCSRPGSLSHTASPSHSASRTLKSHPQTNSLFLSHKHTHTRRLSSHTQPLHFCNSPHAQGTAHTHGFPLRRERAHAQRLSRARGLRGPRGAPGTASRTRRRRGPGLAPRAPLPSPGPLPPGRALPAPLARRARPRPVTSRWPGASRMLGRAAAAPAATAQAPPPPRHPQPDRDSARRVGTEHAAQRRARGRRRFRPAGGRGCFRDSAGCAAAPVRAVPVPRTRAQSRLPTGWPLPDSGDSLGL